MCVQKVKFLFLINFVKDKLKFKGKFCFISFEKLIRTNINDVQFLLVVRLLSLISDYKTKHLNSSKFYYFVI